MRPPTFSLSRLFGEYILCFMLLLMILCLVSGTIGYLSEFCRLHLIKKITNEYSITGGINILNFIPV